MGNEILAGFTFLRPLWLLALLPCLALGWMLYRRLGGQSGWEFILPASWLGWLLQGETRARRGPFLLLTTGWCLAVLVLAGPAVPAPVQVAEQNQASVVVALDLSRNMLAGDLSPSRLDHARRKIQDLLVQPQGYQVGLIAYAGSAHRVTPLSDDDATLANLLGALDPRLMPTQGNDLDAALMLARSMINELPRRTSAILLVTAGAEGEALEALEQHAAALGPQLAILGVGTSAGSPVALPEGGFMRDEAGRILLPRLDAQALAALARRHGSAYHSITQDDSDLRHLLAGLAVRSQSRAEQEIVLRDVGHWALLPLLLLAGMGLRRGWLGVLLCFALLPPSAQAGWADLWQRQDQQAQNLLEAQRAAEAAMLFEDPAWRSWAQFQARNYEQAVAGYARVIERDPANADNHYNYGTALALAGRYEESLEAFEQALTRQPDHRQARHNRAQVEALLEQLREEAARQTDEAASAAADQADREGAPEQTDDTSPGDSAQGEPGSTEPLPAESAPSSAERNGAEQSADSAESAPEGAPAEAPETPLADTEAGDISSPSGQPSEPAEPAASSQPNMEQALEREQQQALHQWLEDIPDNPGELLRRKFLHQHLQQREDR